MCFLVFFYDPHEQAHERIFSISIRLCSNVLKYDVIGLVVYKYTGIMAARKQHKSMPGNTESMSKSRGAD